MPEILTEMPFLRNIGLLMTYKCQVACPHCIIEAGPHRKEEVSVNDAFNWIQQISSYRSGYVKVLSLTGGEPFYNIAHLNKIATFGEDNGLLVSVVTNAFWAFTKEEAVKKLKELHSIKMLAISTDVYHQESIPFEKVMNAILAAKECDVPYNIAVCTENEDDIRYKDVIKRLEEVTGKETINTAITFPAGRALNKIDLLKYQTSEEPPISACSAGSSPIIFPDGRVIACIGPVVDLPISHPLILGNLRKKTLQEILDAAELNTILHAIRIWGPKKIVSIIKEVGLINCLPEKYIKDSICNVCYALLSNRKIVEFLENLADNFEFKRKIAYARIHYLKEAKMVELLDLSH